MEGDPDVSGDVSKYSVLVGFILVVVFVVPCVMFALLAKFFQSPDNERRRSVSVYQLVCVCVQCVHVCVYNVYCVSSVFGFHE